VWGWLELSGRIFIEEKVNSFQVALVLGIEAQFYRG
jgi:hypothetical protein